MIKIELPNGSVINFEDKVNGFQIAKAIAPSLAKKSVAMKVDGIAKDLTFEVEKDAKIELITTDSEEGLDILRHSTAHLLAQAVKELWPEVKVAIGPSIENGFYYDFDREQTFSIDELEKIEKKMLEIVKRDEKLSWEIWDKATAVEYFKNEGEIYKEEIASNLSNNAVITAYKQAGFLDLCRGPHVPSTRYLKHFKLTKVSGAYWKGNSDNKMLQRIYGTAWATKEELESYFKMLEEAERRDHRKIAKVMDLFHFEPEYAPGAPFFHAKGLYVYNTLINHMRKKQEETGYIEVSTPRVMNRVLWETSGHWQKYGEHNYSGQTEDGNMFCIKPMNCPGGVLVYKQGIKSYRDLPLKMAEFGKVNRYEASGALHGLLRVREFTQDDAHIFCTPEQMEAECLVVIKFILELYKDFGFEDVKIKLSTRPEQRIGSDEVWDITENALKESLEKNGYEYTINKGEGAFYGPKLEFVLKDAIGRDWQAGTVQVDMNLPERFDISYIGEDGQKHRPVMIHRAIFGSIERFMGIMIENFEGKFPLWLAPTQIVVATVTNEANDYAEEVYNKLKTQGFKVELDTSSEKIGYKIRQYSLQKTPYIFAVGKKEAENGSVAIRTIGAQGQKVVDLNEAIGKIKEIVDSKKIGYDL